MKITSKHNGQVLDFVNRSQQMQNKYVYLFMKNCFSNSDVLTLCQMAYALYYLNNAAEDKTF